MTFWEAFKETILEGIVGRYQLEAMRQEKIRREECERTVRRYLEESRRS